jgi:hypothetical protein
MITNKDLVDALKRIQSIAFNFGDYKGICRIPNLSEESIDIFAAIVAEASEALEKAKGEES